MLLTTFQLPTLTDSRGVNKIRNFGVFEFPATQNSALSETIRNGVVDNINLALQLASFFSFCVCNEKTINMSGFKTLKTTLPATKQQQKSQSSVHKILLQNETLRDEKSQKKFSFYGEGGWKDEHIHCVRCAIRRSNVSP
ncbi:CLUMA_CG003495, isoform A [Clunio marinus]|uniref:CLUMA_CG003495, isoform A n=1 Tax=Clunio marinus TaxID=568069 RepID=A0A1J1HP51_9DIPT|nr:CLUMA_CG003495, isoform A [Clunio marinus]